MSFMVAIGSWGQPSVIELQARAIRATCGADTPILVSDDHTETAYDATLGEERGRRLKARLLEICERERLIYRDTADVPLGHIGGDLGAFYHGLNYARDSDIDYVCKLSQRFVVDIPNWLAEVCRQMGKFGYNTASRGCFYDTRAVFVMRTECVVMKRIPWLRPDVLEALKPRQLPYATEHLIAELCAKINGGECKLLAPKWLPENRHLRVPGIAWKDGIPLEDSTADYHTMAAKYGVTLGEEFNAQHSCLQPGYRVGLIRRK
ncbi:MAG: hypothetical protein E6R03_01245 [Hyphomicrobiaceae bacterium]|nr:MAG: hypothetical protein E6R03_01245 [Hyphomicrobiaceae bacterium]